MSALSRQFLSFSASFEEQLELPALDEASYQIGYGIEVRVQGRRIRVGSARFLQGEGIAFADAVARIQQLAEAESHSLIYVGIDDALAGVLEMRPSIRPEARGLVRYLKRRGIELIISSGIVKHLFISQIAIRHTVECDITGHT